MAGRNRSKGKSQRRSNAPARQGGGVQRNQPPDARVISRDVVQEITQSFSGPLPPPEVLKQYEVEFPGLAERMIRRLEIPLEMAQAQQSHRIELETTVITGDSRRSWVGLILGFVIAMTAIIGGIVLVLNDKSGQGLAAIIAALASLVGAFVYTERRRGNELAGKRSEA